MSAKNKSLSQKSVFLWLFCHLLISATILGCQGKKKDAPQIYDAVIYTAADVKDFDIEFSKSRLNCADELDCPENVAMLSFQVKNELGQCTGTLISSNTILTNSHCVTPEMKTHPNDCALFGATFRLKSGQLIRRKCRRVIQQTNATKDNLQSPDLALIELTETVPVVPAMISRSGVVESKPYFFYAVNPILPAKDSKDIFPHGTLVKKKGSSSYSSLLTPFYNSRLSPVVNFFVENNALIGGNSGSALRNESGEVIGVMQAALEDPETASSLRLSAGFSLATNLSCLDIDTVSLPKHPLCVKTNSQIPAISLETPTAEAVLNSLVEKNNRRRVLGYTLVYEIKSQPESSKDPVFKANDSDLNYSFEYRTIEPCMTTIQELKPGLSYPATVFDGETEVKLNDRWVTTTTEDNAVLTVDQTSQQVTENSRSGSLKSLAKTATLQLCPKAKDFIKKELLLKALEK